MKGIRTVTDRPHMWLTVHSILVSSCMLSVDFLSVVVARLKLNTSIAFSLYIIVAVMFCRLAVCKNTEQGSLTILFSVTRTSSS